MGVCSPLTCQYSWTVASNGRLVSKSRRWRERCATFEVTGVKLFFFYTIQMALAELVLSVRSSTPLETPSQKCSLPLIRFQVEILFIPLVVSN